MNKLLLKISKYLSSFTEWYAVISLLLPFLNPMSSIAAVEYPVGLVEAMGPEGTVQAYEDLEGVGTSRSSFVFVSVGPIHLVRRGEIGHPER